VLDIPAAHRVPLHLREEHHAGLGVVDMIARLRVGSPLTDKLEVFAVCPALGEFLVPQHLSRDRELGPRGERMEESRAITIGLCLRESDGENAVGPLEL
jgi:hypothetical protein